MNKKKRAARRRSLPVTGRRFSAFVSKDFPWKVLEALISDAGHCLGSEDLNWISTAVRFRDKALLDDLKAAWSLRSMATSADPNLPEWRLKIQLSHLFSKYLTRHSNDSSDLEAACFDRVKTLNERCRRFCLKSKERMFSASGRLDPVFDEARRFILRLIGQTPDFDEVTRFVRHGPGATFGIPGMKADLFTKFASIPYDVVPRARAYARSAILLDERWTAAVNDYVRFKDENPYGVFSIIDAVDRCLTDVNCNRITSVPKDTKKRRPIAIEPTLAVFLQLGVDHVFRNAMKRYGTDLDSQVKNQRLARLGSIDSTPLSPVTIDLSDASDTISLSLVKTLFPPNWYRYLCDIRSQVGVFPSGERLLYWKISSMGNGYTFALESMVFLAIAYGVSRIYGEFHRDLTCVYGDDIIVPAYLGNHTRIYLELAGLTVNTEKSFLHGPARESCGTDWYKGSDVRPVFLKREPATAMDIYSFRNRVWAWFQVHYPEVELLSFDDYVLPLLRGDILYGPYDPDRFDSYLFTFKPVKGSFRNSSFHYKALVAGLAPSHKGQRYQDFYFRSLMNPLKGSSDSSSGSMFDIRKRGDIRIRVSKCISGHWPRCISSLPKSAKSFMG